VESLRDIVGEGERLQLIIEDLLTLTRLNAGNDIPMREFDLVEVVQDVVRTRPERDREFTLEVKGEVPPVTAAETLIRVVLHNLLGNAAKYSPRGSVVDVVISRGDHGGAEVRIMDRGPGIEGEAAQRIFDP